ncbi:fatty acid desaturase [Candidatus Uabimicrobium sp. HlEnr_7]|uniref:fatty acid desaturase family protein n=1 Tax=Candidatus Uabimicrobium helgolandensis TaxID=3095367 RepID=UPI0035581F57
MNNYYHHTKNLRQELKVFLDVDVLKNLHRKVWWKHFLICFKQILVLGLCCLFIFLYNSVYVWLPCSIVIGFITFAWNPLLHEVIHGGIFQKKQPFIENIIGYFYANMGGLCKTQFTRWHLQHHSELGSFENDPKRAYLTPKIVKRWYKCLYLTPMLFLIYFRAANKETRSYPQEVQRQIKFEKLLLFMFHGGLFFMITKYLGIFYALKMHIIPYFLVFPIAFTINRLGQHYAIDPEDSAHWTTLISSGLVVNTIFLYSNLHLEHHYFPRIPCYNLPKLQHYLLPFYKSRGIQPRKYRWLIYHWFILNQRPHENWHKASLDC